MNDFGAQNDDPENGNWTAERLSDVDPAIGSQFVRQAQEVSGLAFRHLDLAARRMLASDNYEEVFGFPATANIDEFLSYVHPDDRDSFMAGRARHEVQLGRNAQRFRIVLPSGEVRWIETLAETLADENGRPARILLASRDISRILTAEVDRKVTAERLDRIQAAAKIGAWEWDIGSGAASWSQTAWELLEPGGTGPVTLDRWLAAVHPDDREHAQRNSLAGAETGSFQFEYRVKRPDGTIGWLQSMGSLVRDDSGKPQLMRGVVWDITERKQNQQALRDADRRKDEFLATLAHELRNPLAPLQSAADVMRHLEVGDPSLSMVRQIVEQQTSHLTRLVEDLLDISRLSSGKLTLKKAPTSVAEAISAAVQMCQADVEDRQHRLDIGLPPQPIMIEADKFRLTQVLANLIGNASKYTPDGGKIVVCAAIEAEHVCISVQDNGVGISTDFLPHVFDAFTQAPEEKQKAAGGLGLGLMLVRQIVDLHGGTVSAASPGLGQGSRFEVRFPLPIVPRKSASPGPAAARHAMKGVGLKVLLVDDYAAIRDSMELMLSMRGLVVATAESGEAALAKLATFKPDAVVLDIRMPGMSGIEVARAIGRMPEWRHLKLIAMTGNDSEHDLQMALAVGFQALAVKPVRAEQLIDLLASSDVSSAAGRQAVA